MAQVLGLDELPQNLECSIAEELALDSLDQLSLFMALEDEFGGRIKEEDAEKISTLRDIVDYVQKWVMHETARRYNRLGCHQCSGR
mgnify:CR=1 FL=1